MATTTREVAPFATSVKFGNNNNTHAPLETVVSVDLKPTKTLPTRWQLGGQAPGVQIIGTVAFWATRTTTNDAPLQTCFKRVNHSKNIRHTPDFRQTWQQQRKLAPAKPELGGWCHKQFCT